MAWAAAGGVTAVRLLDASPATRGGRRGGPELEPRLDGLARPLMRRWSGALLLAALDHVPQGYAPSGVAVSVATPSLVVRILNLSLLLSAANSVLLSGLYAANGETAAAVAAAGFVLV